MVANYATVPWQRGGIIIDQEIYSVDQALTLMGANWDVRIAQGFFPRPYNPSMFTIARGYNYVIRNDNNAVLGAVRDRYEVVQNKDAFDFFGDMLRDKSVHLQAGGVLGAGATVWMLAKIRNGTKGVGSSDIEPYLLLSTSHNGSSRITARFTPVRMVCSNMLNYAMSGNKPIMAIKHTSSATGRIKLAGNLISWGLNHFDAFCNVLKELEQTPITDKQLTGYFRGLVPEKQIKKCEAYWRLERDVVGSGRNWDTAYQAVTGYVDHERAKKKGSRVEAIMFGTGSALKEKAFSLAREMCNV